MFLQDKLSDVRKAHSVSECIHYLGKLAPACACGRVRRCVCARARLLGDKPARFAADGPRKGAATQCHGELSLQSCVTRVCHSCAIPALPPFKEPCGDLWGPGGAQALGGALRPQKCFRKHLRCQSTNCNAETGHLDL